MPHISEAAPLQISRFYTGWYTYRNPTIVPIRQMGRRIIELYDAISDGFNMECTNRLTLARRPGYTPVSPNPISINGPTLAVNTAKYFYTFKPSSFPGQCYQVIDTTGNVIHFQPNGVSYEQLPLTGVFVPVKPTPALTNFATVGAFLYMAQEAMSAKWDAPSGPQGVTRWGIDMYHPNYTLSGTVGAIANQLVLPNPDPGLPSWTATGTTLPTWVVKAQVPRPAGNIETLTSTWIHYTDWGINFPQTTGFEIAGIEVRFDIVTSEPEGTSLNVRLLRNKNLYGTTHTVTLPANDPTGIVLLGRPSDLWDGSWTISDVTNIEFGVAFQAVNSSRTQANFTLTNVQLTVYQNVRPTVNLATALAGQTPFNNVQTGYFYKYCYGNSHSGHLSSPTPPSFFSGPDGTILPLSAVGVNLVASDDPQVDSIHVFRTTDGGGNPYFELPTSPYPNLTQTIVDSAADNTLQIANICPDPYFNDPPPFGAIDPVWFSGRLWMHRKHQLFFASGPDVTMGNGEEAWYPVYVFSVPSEIIRKYATPNGMLLVCVDDILIVRGISTATFTVTDFAKDIGQRVWTAGDTDGTNIYLYSSDRQFLLISPNGLSTISKEIADQIQTVDPTKAYVAQFRYTASENMVFLGDGSTTVFPYNQEVTAWNVPQQPVHGVGAIGTVEVSPGVFQLWRARNGSTGSLISYRDWTSFTDEGTSYTCSATFGPIPVADFLTLSQLRDIALVQAATSTNVTLSVLANEIFPIANSQYQILQISSSEPPELSATPSLSYTANRYTWKSAPLPELVNLCFLRLDFSADPNPDELFSWTLGGSQTTGGSSLGAPGQLPQLQGR